MSMLDALSRELGCLDEARARAVTLAITERPQRVVSLVQLHGTMRRALEEDPSLQPRHDRQSARWRRRAAAEVEAAARQGVELVMPEESTWPECLRTSHQPPALLYVAGALPGPEAPGLALVGSRRMAEYGRRVARRFGSAWATMGGTVVSGGALGVDRAAHEGALEGDGETVAVLGSGLARPHPGSNRDLFLRIRERGALVSELPMQCGARPFNFPRRNRLIAGFSRAVVVVQAAKGSGSLHTATFALKCDRLLFTVPAPVDDDTCAGGLELLAQGIPAMIDVGQLERLFGKLAGRPAACPGLPAPASGRRPEVSLSDLEPKPRKALELLGRGVTHMDDLSSALGLSVGRLSMLLLDLEIKKLVEKTSGNHYICNARLVR